MNTENKNKVEQETEESKQQAMAEARKNKEEGGDIHTINPFTGAEVTITPEEMDGIEKFNEAQTERD